MGVLYWLYAISLRRDDAAAHHFLREAMKDKDKKAAKDFKEKFFLETDEIITKILPIIQSKMFTSVIDSFITISARLVVDNFTDKEEIAQCGMDFMQKFMATVEDFYNKNQEKCLKI